MQNASDRTTETEGSCDQHIRWIETQVLVLRYSPHNAQRGNYYRADPQIDLSFWLMGLSFDKEIR